MEDADKPIGHGSKGLMMGVSGVSVAVIEGSCSRRSSEGDKGPLIGGISDAFVTSKAGQHDPLGARGSRDGRRAGVVFARLGIAVPIGVIPELTEHPSPENRPESWQGTDDLGGRVFVKRCGDLRFERVDLTVELVHDVRHGRHALSEGDSHTRRRRSASARRAVWISSARARSDVGARLV